MGKHLLDETAEFSLPRAGRHAAEGQDEDDRDATQRFGSRRTLPAPGPQQDPGGR